jgi:chitin disaccharide deacetylase
MKQLIINADDFGMSYEVNEGIKRGINEGVINSVSLMVNMPYFNDAVRYLRSKPEIAVGLHFNITEGKPIDKPKTRSSLIREDNNFFSWVYLTLKLLTRNYSIDEIRNSLKTQYDMLEKTGLEISHIDSHHHIHLYPSVYKLVLEFAKRKKIRSLRSRNFLSWSIITKLKTGLSIKQIIVITLCYVNNLLFPKRNHEMLKIRSIYDMTWDKQLDIDRFKYILSNLGEGITEIICHPAILSKDGNPEFLEPRHRTLIILLDKSLKNYLKENNIYIFRRNMHSNAPEYY